MKWYLVCYLGTANTITVDNRLNTKEEALDYMKNARPDLTYFILEVDA